MGHKFRQLDRMDTGVCALVPPPNRFNDESAGSIYVTIAVRLTCQWQMGKAEECRRLFED
jgi:hypothetical protein